MGTSVDMNAILRDVDKYCQCVRTELLIPDTAALLRLFAQRYGRQVKLSELAQIARDLTKLADKNDPAATYELGLCYYQSVGVNFDYEEAARRFRSAAERRNADAMNALGVCYMEGRGVDYSPEKAIKMFQLGAKNNSLAALYNLGLSYYNGYGVEPNETRGLDSIKKAAELGFAEAIGELGKIAASGDLPGAPEGSHIKYFSEGARKGSAHAIFNLGIAYSQGDGVPQDMSKAFEYFKRAYDAGYVRAFFTLDQCYRNGIGVEQNVAAADAVIREAAELNEPHAVWNYATTYVDDAFGAAEGKQAVELFIKGAHYGSDLCALMVGDLINDGLLGEEGKPTAVKYWALSSFNGNGDASAKLANCFFQGHIVPQNHERAFQLLNRSVEQGSAIGCFMLGTLLMEAANDTGAPPEDQWKMRARAAELFEHGAEENDVHCIRELANCYKKGIGVDKNETRAKNLLKRAKEIEREKAKEEGTGGFFGWITRLFRR